MRKQADALASEVRAPAPLELDLAVSVHVQQQPGQPALNQAGQVISLHGQGASGPTYVATPALLKASGISRSEVNPEASVLTCALCCRPPVA